MIKTDGKPTIAWDPKLEEILNADSPEPSFEDEEAEDENFVGVV